jgi:hypothetical protein
MVNYSFDFSIRLVWAWVWGIEAKENGFAKKANIFFVVFFV